VDREHANQAVREPTNTGRGGAAVSESHAASPCTIRNARTASARWYAKAAWTRSPLHPRKRWVAGLFNKVHLSSPKRDLASLVEPTLRLASPSYRPQAGNICLWTRVPTNAVRIHKVAGNPTGVCPSGLLIALLVSTGLRPVRGETVPLKRDHGTFLVPVVINGQMTLNFTLDSGASDVTIPLTSSRRSLVLGQLRRPIYLIRRCISWRTASQTRSQRVRIRSLRVGGVELRDVIASVAPQAGILLLGQSFLARLESWTIDNHGSVWSLTSHRLQALRPLPRGLMNLSRRQIGVHSVGLLAVSLNFLLMSPASA